MNDNKLQELVGNVFKDYPQNACLYIGKYRFKTEEDTSPDVYICFPWEATDIEDIPFPIFGRGAIMAEHPKESIDKLLMYLLDNKPTDCYTLKEPGKDFYLYIDQCSRIHSVRG